MKKKILKITGLILCLIVAFSTFTTTGCSKASLSGTALAKALLAKERINHEHLSSSFDFLDDRLNESAVAQNEVQPFASAFAAVENYSSNKGQVISGSKEEQNRVISWSDWTKLAVELKYFKSHFEAGQNRTDKVEDNIAFLESSTDIKGKWIKGVSWMDYLMQVEENREIIYERDDYNENYSVGIRTVNDQVDTTYEYYENQGDLYIRTLATPNRRYEYSTIQNDGEVMAFVADNDNGYWRFVQLNSSSGESLSVSVIVMTDELAYDFRCSISQNSKYSYSTTILSPDLQYEIAQLNSSEITIYPSAFTGINELRVDEAEQIALGEYGEWIGYSNDYDYYSTYAIPHIITSKGTIQAAIPGPSASGGTTTTPTVLDEKVSYVDGNLRGAWEHSYAELVFEVEGENYPERFDNLHAALAKYDIEPIYDASKIGLMAEDVDKLAESFCDHYVWNGQKLVDLVSSKQAIDAEINKSQKYELLYQAAQALPTATKGELIEAQQNAAFAPINFGGDATVTVQNGKVALSGISATVDSNAVLEKGVEYELKIALKKNTDQLEELVVLDNLLTTQKTAYQTGALNLTLSGEFNLPADVSVGEYDLVAYAATADDGIRISKFKRVLCVGQVNDQATLGELKVITTLTAEKYLRSTYIKLFDIKVKITAEKESYTKAEVLAIIESAIMDKGYFKTGAQLERYDVSSDTGVVVTDDNLTKGTYRLKYLGKADGGEIQAYVYLTIE